MSSQHEVNRSFHWNFESLDEAIEYAINRPKKSSQSDSRRETNGDWYGTQTFDEAVHLARTGWPEGTQRVHDLQEKMNVGNLQSIIGMADVATTDVSGAYVDVGLYLEGEPECMVEWEETRADNPRLVTVYVNLCYSAGTDTDKILRRGAAAAALVDLLEQVGISTEVVLVSGNKWKPANAKYKEAGSAVRVVVKRNGEPLDLDRLAFALVHPAMFRRIVFSMWESEPDLDYGYGRVGEIKPTQVPEDDIVIGTVSLHGDAIWESDSSTIAWMRETLARYVPELA